MMVDIEPVIGLKENISLDAVKNNPECDGMLLVRKGQRLSVQPVEEEHFCAVLRMARMTLEDLG